MGLDITAYKNLKKVENPVFDEEGNVADYKNNWQPGERMIWSENIWAGRGEGLEPNAVYSFENNYKFSAGSYDGYIWWRDKLKNFSPDKGEAFLELIEFTYNKKVV